MMRRLLLLVWGLGSWVHAQEAGTAFTMVLPTDNRGLLEGRPADFYQFIDRTVNGKQVEVWEGGEFGFVRSPITLKTGEVVNTRFHEGLDIKPVQRDAKGEPLDEVRCMAAGEVVHASVQPGASNYGRYVVVRHDLADGPFVSLYAHLREVTCTVGQKVEPGSKLGIMGYSGVGIDRRRAHTHVEMGVYLSSRFAVWHDHLTPTLNHHGMWNGLNIVGFDLGKYLTERAANPKLMPSEFIQSMTPHFRVAVPGQAEMEILQHYPWLCANRPAEKPKSWIISFSAWGLPVKVEASEAGCEEFNVTWFKVVPPIPQFSLTRGLLNGIADRARLTNDGVSFMELATGMFEARPKVASPVTEAESRPQPKSKAKKSPAKSKKKAAR